MINIVIEKYAGGDMKCNYFYYMLPVLLLVSCTFSDNLLAKITNQGAEETESAISLEATNESGDVEQGSLLTETPSSAGSPQLIEGATSIYQTIQNKYLTQSGTPLGMENFLHPTQACDWMGVAGQVFNLEGQPKTGYVVQVGGELEGSNVLFIAMTGGNTSVGVGGYEIVLTDHVVASTQKLWVQLFDLEGKPLSDKIRFDTYADCEKNLILINLTETVIAYLYDFFMPVIINN